MKKFLALSLSDVVFIMLINVKMPTIVGILTFMSRINFVHSWVEHGKSFITSGQSFSVKLENNVEKIQTMGSLSFTAKNCDFSTTRI